ncbi:MAG: hypothetical protein WBC60_16255 [Cognaticolwellia sp.]
MFSQILLAMAAVWLFYLGVTTYSVFDILAGCCLMIKSAAMFYAAKTGSSFQEEMTKWYAQRNSKKEML